jgi:hypothetical protein
MENYPEPISPNPQNAAAPPDPLPGHEHTDVSPFGITMFGIGLFVSVAVTLLGVALLMHLFIHADAKLANTRLEPGAASLVYSQPEYDGPLLQIVPERDLDAMRSNNAATLSDYHWVDRQSGAVAIPIERAMELIAQRGLPPVSPGVTLEDMQRQRSQPAAFRQNISP